MNYFDFSAWTHPESLEVCKTVFADAVQGKFDDYFWGENSLAKYHSFSWERSDNLAVEMTIYEGKIKNHTMHTVWGSSWDEKANGDYICTKEEVCFGFGVGEFAKYPHASQTETYNGTYDLKILARFFYWMGIELEHITCDNPLIFPTPYTTLFPQSEHEKIEIFLERKESWQKMWHLRPNGIE